MHSCAQLRLLQLPGICTLPLWFFDVLIMNENHPMIKGEQSNQKYITQLPRFQPDDPGGFPLIPLEGSVFNPIGYITQLWKDRECGIRTFINAKIIMQDVIVMYSSHSAQ